MANKEKQIEDVYIFPNGMRVVLNAFGNQVPELQNMLLRDWQKHAIKNGYDLTNMIIRK